MINLARDFLENYPPRLVAALAEAGRTTGKALFVAGGAVRDMLLGRTSPDLDVTLSAEALACAQAFARRTGGAYVLLDAEECVARVVLPEGYTVDFSGFRKGARDIAADLVERDFTVNAMAVAFDCERAGLQQPFQIIDPAGGLRDLALRSLRVTNDGVFADDPLRLLRAYRFMATLGFEIAPETADLIRANRRLITSSSVERILYELQQIMSSEAAPAVLGSMAASGLLWEIFPELQAGVGLRQPSSHHLDVYAHSQETLRCLEPVLKNPETYYPGPAGDIRLYLADPEKQTLLRWAALFHDLGKPATRDIQGDKLTFYNHDKVGSDTFLKIAERLRWRRDDARVVAKFIEYHMLPFHLNNARRKTGITARACLRLVRKVGDDLPGLFLLAMADSLAGQGPGKPAGTEESLAELYAEVAAVYRHSVKPVLDKPLLLNGHDLQDVFALTPGPIFRTILTGLQEAQVEKEVCTREEALAWVTAFLQSMGAR